LVWVIKNFNEMKIFGWVFYLINKMVFFCYVIILSYIKILVKCYVVKVHLFSIQLCLVDVVAKCFLFRWFINKLEKSILSGQTKFLLICIVCEVRWYSFQVFFLDKFFYYCVQVSSCIHKTRYFVFTAPSLQITRCEQGISKENSME
jgi:hypothetical protein